MRQECGGGVLFSERPPEADLSAGPYPLVYTLGRSAIVGGDE